TWLRGWIDSWQVKLRLQKPALDALNCRNQAGACCGICRLCRKLCLRTKSNFRAASKYLSGGCMTPEERFERIEAQLELLATFMSQSAEQIDQRFDRIREHIEQLGRRVNQTSRDVAVGAEAGAALARLLYR